jgi:hypothetical protein
VPAAPTFVLDLDVGSGMPPVWQIRTNLIEDGQHGTWLVLSFGPQQTGPGPTVAANYSYSLLAYGLPTIGSTCGLDPLPVGATCFGDDVVPHHAVTWGVYQMRRLFPDVAGPLFPPAGGGAYPKDGRIGVVVGSGGSVALRFRLVPGAEPVDRSGSFVSFSLPPVVANVTGPAGTSFSTSLTFDTEIGASELRVLGLTAAANGPNSTLRDPAVHALDPTNAFLTSWLWVESDPISGTPGTAGSAQSTPVDISAATDVATSQAETHSALVAGVLFGIAGGALITAVQELLGGLRRWPRTPPGQPSDS